jgi:isopenicillin N synthase-like dioxygenase
MIIPAQGTMQPPVSPIEENWASSSLDSNSIEAQKLKINENLSASSSTLSKKEVFDLQGPNKNRELEVAGLTSNSPVEILDLDLVSCQELLRGNVSAIRVIKKALLEKGIVGVDFTGDPHYETKVQNFIAQARDFAALPEEIKQKYAPNRAKEEYLGYEVGKEKFQRPDGNWVVDNSKASYYFTVPDSPENKWPEVEGIQNRLFQQSVSKMGSFMLTMAKMVLAKIEMLKPQCGVELEHVTGVGRVLHYSPSESTSKEWCGRHFDHSLFTALLPGFYFKTDGLHFNTAKAVPEPAEAGLFVKTTKEGAFKKVVVNNPNIMLFQVGEFGQAASNDGIKATEHEVRAPIEPLSRETLAVFLSPRMHDTIHSTSVLTADSRYEAKAGEPCPFGRWHKNSLARYAVKAY